MRITVFDIETDGLLDEVTKIHCLSYQIIENFFVVGSGSLTDSESIKDFIISQEVICGHNIIRYDIPVMEKLLGIKITCKRIDTLGWSWYLYPFFDKHGLELWGVRVGVAKVKVDDDQWKEGDLELMVNRCEEDVEINKLVLYKMLPYMCGVYNYQIQDINNFLSYKMECLRDQEEIGIDLDIDLVETSKFKLEFLIEEKKTYLSDLMPMVEGKKAPKVMFKKDGTLSAHGHKWRAKLGELGLPEDTEIIMERGNPNSSDQLKAWLTTLGWKPQTFKDSKATGESIPQVSLPFGQGLCPSVKELYEVVPDLIHLENLYMLVHRLGLFKSFLKNKTEDDKVRASANGLTNTTRYTHSSPVVNLPGPDNPWGKEVRGSLYIKPEERDEWIMLGSDVCALEDKMKLNYCDIFDHEYVEKVNKPDYDAHLEIALQAELITRNDINFYQAFDEKTASEEDKVRYKAIHKQRKDGKVTNFAATYLAMPPKLSEILKKPLDFAQKLYNAYWEVNSAIKTVTDSFYIKKVNGQRWLYNPFAKIWLFLKHEKDAFSTGNQSLGSYTFSLWRKIFTNLCKERGIEVYILLEYHD